MRLSSTLPRAFLRRLIPIAILLQLSFAIAGARLQQGGDRPTAIVGAMVVDGTGRVPFAGNVIIRGERIEAVGPAGEIPQSARIIDGRGRTLIPGIFDVHTHLPYAAASGITGDWPKNLKSYLYCGVTSVVDFGTYPETFEPMRRLIETGVVEAPRISLAARMTTPGGHGAEGGRGDIFSLEVSTPRQARSAVQSVLPYRPDVIKVFTDGWRYGAAPDMTSMNQETLTALVDEAHKHGLEVLTHTVTLEKAKIAARAGVDIIAHGIGNAEADEELIGLMKASGTTYAPTLAVYEPRGRDILTPLLSAVLEPSVRLKVRPELTLPGNGTAPRVSEARQLRWRYLQHNTAAMSGAGVTFAAGTDAGVSGTYHGWATLRELQLLVAGGLTPLQALTAATGHAARALKVDDQRGTIAPGKLADLVLIDGEPHKDIAAIEKISRVFLGGRELERDKLAADIAAAGPTAIPSIRAARLIDDFERPDGRSRLDTLWVNSTDSGHDNSAMLFGRIDRETDNHALSVTGRMSDKDSPFVRINVPLSRGAIEPVDARQSRGVQFEIRGSGDYKLIIPTCAVRDDDHFEAPFQASPAWRTVRIEFSSLKRNMDGGEWTGADLLMLSFEIARPAGSFVWMELDNISFF